MLGEVSQYGLSIVSLLLVALFDSKPREELPEGVFGMIGSG